MCVCVCVCVALGIQYVMLMRHIVICGMYGSIVFFSLSHKQQDFRKKNMECKMLILILSTNFV